MKTKGHIEVRNPYSGELIDIVPNAAAEDVQRALDVAVKGKEIARTMPRHQRAAVLARAADLVCSRAEDFAEVIVREAGKTIQQARTEVGRCENTMRLSAEEAKRNVGELVPFDSFQGAENRHGYFKRDPIGVVVAITPFNDPLNLVAHKLGPAIAGGNAVILKPASLTPLSAIKLAETLFEAGLPKPCLTVLTGRGEVGQALVTAREVSMISFTGGAETGEDIANHAGLKHLSMDLGGNGPVIVLDDCNMDDAVKACISGAFSAAGQNCIGVQRLLVHQEIYEKFTDEFANCAKALKTGDPMLEETDMGPMITEQEAERVEHWVVEALRGGAGLIVGNRRRGSLLEPTVLNNVPEEAPIRCNEVFGPVVMIQRIDNLDEAITEANRTEFSLHAAIFTRNIDCAFEAADRLDAGGVMINDSTDFRFDGMPFGGYKRGGLGREGVRFALEEMTQTKVVCITQRPRRLAQ